MICICVFRNREAFCYKAKFLEGLWGGGVGVGERNVQDEVCCRYSLF